MFLVGVLALGVLGCMGGGKKGAGNVDGAAGGGKVQELTVRSSGTERSAWVHYPRADAKKVPVVVMLHGGNPNQAGPNKGRNNIHLWESHFDEPILFVFPNSDFTGKSGAWSGPNDPDPQRDIKLVHDLVDAVAQKADIDRSRIYLAGFSSGAAFTWYANCVDSEYFRGFAMNSVPLPDMIKGSCNGGPKRPVLYLHGTEDPVVPFGRSEFAAGGAAGTFEWLRESRRCAAPASEPVKNGTRGVTLRGKVFDCPGGAFEVWRAEGQGHCVATKDSECGGYEWSDMVVDFWTRTAGL